MTDEPLDIPAQDYIAIVARQRNEALDAAAAQQARADVLAGQLAEARAQIAHLIETRKA